GGLGCCRGSRGHADELAETALGQAAGPLRAGFLFRLAEIELYRGRFDDAREHAGSGLEMARADGDEVRACRWTNLLAEVEYFSGNVETATGLVRRALDDAQRLPTPGQDQTLLASLLQNDALVSEATGDWPMALDRQQQALAIRREAEDARGAAQSLHGIGKAYCGLSRPDEAEQALDEAVQAADMLG